ncbi:hypothetical protein CHS0354_034155 [Potamilus streckersoni]|uniref:Vacuolar ATPase assembly protein VMA22 n=1 Tax=Potamilus streckersoni TaxID=2493646 RepID=A0AAE0VGR7_9BIVA|nr:hypothetical protein CHS0354_034155 [Potamilus streckersoni]
MGRKMAESENINFTQLCDKLDDVVLEFFNTLSTLYEVQDKLEETMKSGFLNLSRSRYNMGIKSVSCLQWDENNMVAATKVCVDLSSSFTPFSLQENKSTEAHVPPETETTTLRYRKVASKSFHDDDKEKIEDLIPMMKIESSSKETMKGLKSKDPLHWFGVLVPQTLRQSQRQFQDAVELTVTIANLRTKLLSLRKDYVGLKREKRKFNKSVT